MSAIGPNPDRLKVARPAIPLYRPDLSGNERRYVLECLDSSWISSHGSFIERFEEAFAEAVGVEHALTVSNGTVALHLALHCLDVGPADEVIVPTFTYIASVNSIAQTGATPVFADCRTEDWLLDPEDVARRITPRTKAIMPVHLYGAVCDMPRLEDLARKAGCAIVEDCAEALGASLEGRHPGTFGEVGTFSFFGNKTVTTGEGGMVVTRTPRLAQRLRLVKGQSPTKRYWHIERGFNYRMTNICAAIGLAQMERFPAILARKRRIAERYRALLGDLPVTPQRPMPGVQSSDWLFSLLLPEGVDREAVMAAMEARGVETRPVFHCAHRMPMYDRGDRYPVAENIAAHGMSLPSFPDLTDDEIAYVVDTLCEALRRT
jgi:perosamine synthetase